MTLCPDCSHAVAGDVTGRGWCVGCGKRYVSPVAANRAKCHQLIQSLPGRAIPEVIQLLAGMLPVTADTPAPTSAASGTPPVSTL